MTEALCQIWSSVSDPEDPTLLCVVRWGLDKCEALGPNNCIEVELPPLGVISGDIEGDRVANGDSAGEKLGDIAGDEKVLS